jgi:hypothetical protein
VGEGGAAAALSSFILPLPDGLNQNQLAAPRLLLWSDATNRMGLTPQFGLPTKPPRDFQDGSFWSNRSADRAISRQSCPDMRQPAGPFFNPGSVATTATNR